jgi:hypothetical protein
MSDTLSIVVERMQGALLLAVIKAVHYVCQESVTRL